MGWGDDGGEDGWVAEDGWDEGDGRHWCGLGVGGWWPGLSGREWEYGSGWVGGEGVGD